MKKIDELPKDDIIKSVSKSFKKNIKWGLLAGAASVVVGHFWFNLTESWQKKLIAKSESYDAESKALMEQVKAQKELNAAIKSGDKVAQKAALEKYNAAVEQEVAIKNARKNGNPEKVQDSEPAEKSETEVNVDEKMTDELQEDK